MTLEQEADEQASIEKFVNGVFRKVRPKSASAAVAFVILTTARAAANIAARTSTGAISEEEANKIFQEAVRLMQGFAPAIP